MKPTPDWTKITDDPNDPQAKKAIRDWLLDIRRLHTDTNLHDYIVGLAKGKRVLDIGVVSHSARYFEQPGWRHGAIRQVAAYCLGIDILEALVTELQARGFNVRCVDATSEIDIGERFDLVFIGDVIEHVNNPVLLLQFAARHLLPSGKIFAVTPNPFSRKFYRQFLRDGVPIVNLDHVSWITPTQALEIGRRAGVRLTAYHLVKKNSSVRKTDQTVGRLACSAGRIFFS